MSDHPITLADVFAPNKEQHWVKALPRHQAKLSPTEKGTELRRWTVILMLHEGTKH